MSSKLDLLAQKEEQLRLLNAQLDQKKPVVYHHSESEEEEVKDYPADDSYEDDEFQADKTNTIQALMELGRQEEHPPIDKEL